MPLEFFPLPDDVLVRWEEILYVHHYAQTAKHPEYYKLAMRDGSVSTPIVRAQRAQFQYLEKLRRTVFLTVEQEVKSHE